MSNRENVNEYFDNSNRQCQAHQADSANGQRIDFSKVGHVTSVHVALVRI